MNHEDTFIVDIETAKKTLESSVSYIVDKHNNIKKERDDMLTLLRSCDKSSPSQACDKISNYLMEYDIPF